MPIRYRLILATILFVFQIFPAQAADKLSSLPNDQLTKLVTDLSAFYNQSLDALFSVTGDEQERQLGQRVGQELMQNFDARVAGRCTKAMTSQVLNQYISVAYGRMRKAKEAGPEKAAKLVAEYAELLKAYSLDPSDLKKTGDCSVFEYDLEPLYESPITVFDPGWWIFNQDRQAKTFIRIMTKGQKEDGSVELEAYVGAGSPKGHYTGVAKRDLHSTSIQVSLMRDGGEPMLVDGELTMSGTGYKDPLTDELAPKMPARVLSGFLTVHDGEKHKINNAVMLVARESDAAIGKALGGFQIPSDASYGSYLNVLLVSFQGRGIGRDLNKFVALVDEAYKNAQKDNPVQSFHPTRKPLFMNDNEVAFLVTDIASDVNALAASRLRSEETRKIAAELGARVYVVPFYQVKDGKLRVQFPGKPASEMKFKGFEGLAKSIFTMYAALGQQQQQFFEKFGIKKISDDIKATQAEVVDSYKAMGPILDGLLDGRQADEALDKTLSSDMAELLKKGQAIVQTLSTILDTRDTAKFVSQYEEFIRLESTIISAASVGAPSEKNDVVAQLMKKTLEASTAALEHAQRLAASINDNTKKIDATLNYLNTFTVRVELEGKYVANNGKLVSWTWKWERTLSSELETLFMGEKYETKTNVKGRRGD